LLAAVEASATETETSRQWYLEGEKRIFDTAMVNHELPSEDRAPQPVEHHVGPLSFSE